MEQETIKQIISRIGEDNLAKFRTRLLNEEYLRKDPKEFDETFIYPSFKERLFDRVSESLKYYIGPAGMGAFCGLAWSLGINVLTTWPNLKLEPPTLIGLGLVGAIEGLWFAAEAQKARYLS